MTEPSMTEPSMAARLSAFLSAEAGRAIDVREMRRIAVGHSRAMYRVDCTDEMYVLRMEQGGVFGTSSTEEFSVMQAIAEAGVPVAAVRWFEPSGRVLGQPFFVMDFIEGAEGTDERIIDGDTCADFVRVLHRMHELDTTSLRSAFRVQPEIGDATHEQVERWLGIARSAAPEPVPLIEEAAAWLHHHAPPLQRLSVVHGDAGPGNFVHADDRVRAITDWEFAHLGDPAEDWVFCAAMRGTRTMSRDDWIAQFARVGVVLDDAQWRYWEAFNLFKGACANRTCLTLFETGANRAPNMAIIGTTLHQVFLRRLVDLTAREPSDAP